MDKENSRGHKDSICSTKATLHYASTLKADIQNQVYVLTATLKKIEHELCMQIDRQCREKLKGLEYLCENDKCGAGCQNVNIEVNGDGIIGFPRKTKLNRDFKSCMRLLQNYGQEKKFDFSKIMSWGSQVKKADPAKGQIDTKETANCTRKSEEDCGDLFEFVDSVECLLEEGQSVLKTLLKDDSNDLTRKVDESEEALERASCCSVESFDVIPNECCMNDSVCSDGHPPLPGIVRLPILPETASSKDNPGHPTFYLPNLQKKEPRLFSRIFKRSPSTKWTAEKSFLDTTKDDKVLTWTPNITEEEMEQKMRTFVTTINKVVDDNEVLSSSSAANATAEQETTDLAEDASPEEPPAVSADGNNPASALRDSFNAYLQKKDLKTWVHQSSEPKADSYDNWVFRAHVPTDHKSMAEFVKGFLGAKGISTKSLSPSDVVGQEFYRQLQAFNGHQKEK